MKIFAPIRLTKVLCFGIAMGVAAIVHGSAINVDFNGGGGTTYSGTAAAPDTGTVWNGINAGNGTSGVLTDSLGNPTVATVTQSNISGGFSSGGDFSNTGAAALMEDQTFVAGYATATITINNLGAGPYDLYIYEDRGNTNEETTFTVNGVPKTSTPDDPNTTGFHAPEDYVLFTGLTPVGGKISFDFTGVTTQYGATNGFQLTPAPEPTSALILEVGAFGVLATGRARRKWA